MTKDGRFVGRYSRYPDETGKRQAEGGLRLQGGAKESREGAPLVSVVTVVLNMAEDLEETVRCVRGQTYGNVEHIVVDGGSTDGTLDVCRRHADHLDYFVSEPDGGLYQGMNKGIRLAQGDYVCLLNAGDLYQPTFVEETVEQALKTRADIVYCDMEFAGRKSAVPINDGIFIHYMNINHEACLVARECYERVGPYSESYRICSDVQWMHNAYRQGARFAYLPRCLLQFAAGGISSGGDEKRRQRHIREAGECIRENFEFLSQQEAEELYMSRSHLGAIDTLESLTSRYVEHRELFRSALHHYLTFALNNFFVFRGEAIEEYLPRYRSLARELEVPFDCLNIQCEELDVARWFQQARRLKAHLDERSGATRILHFVSRFSSPSETFIYDLVTRLEEQGWCRGVVLCDRRLMAAERPFDYCLCCDWEEVPEAIRDTLYEHAFSLLELDVVVAHFAINGWKLHERIAPLGIEVPTVYMTHGIDVFSVDTEPEYGEFVTKHISYDPKSEVTCVSDYLRRELVKRGVPSAKIQLVPNCVHERFFTNRKTSGFYDGERTLKVLTVGRLIELKGHKYLVQGIAELKRKSDKKIHLTIVYGRDASRLGEIQAEMDRLGLTESDVSFVELVDFRERPDFFAEFDVYVTSSKYSDDVMQRSESFGMSTLEAIAAGLPVVVTDAGGSPEVVGEDGTFARIVPNSNGPALADALLELVEDMSGFRDNIDYAKQRLALFNPGVQLARLRQAIERVRAKKLRVHVFSSLVAGGAGGAAMRVHRALLVNGVDARFYTRSCNGSSPYPGYHRLVPDVGRTWGEIQSIEHFRPGYTAFSLNEPKLRRRTLRRVAEQCDVINLHWIAKFLSAEDIGYLSRLGKPLVITVRDMHPLTGGCHYFHGCDRWQSDCFGCPQLLEDDRHFPSKVLRAKKRYWRTDNITAVALSEHSKRIIQRSALLGDCRVEVIGNPIDLDVFVNFPRLESRRFCRLRPRMKTLFYMPSFRSLVKGSNEFWGTLAIFKDKYPDVELQIMIAGSGGDLVEGAFPYPTVDLGRIGDDELLARAYSAADVTAIPSLEETFSNTAAESVACGTPIVGFETGAIPEISGGGARGDCAPVGDMEGLADVLYRTLQSDVSSSECRRFAEERFSPARQGEKYAALFRELAENAGGGQPAAPDEVPTVDAESFLDLLDWHSWASHYRSIENRAPDPVESLRGLNGIFFSPRRRIAELERLLKVRERRVRALETSYSFRFGHALALALMAPVRLARSLVAYGSRTSKKRNRIMPRSS